VSPHLGAFTRKATENIGGTLQSTVTARALSMPVALASRGVVLQKDTGDDVYFHLAFDYAYHLRRMACIRAHPRAID
jgi:hypothetical protein